jgi:hypothetical protein
MDKPPTKKKPSAQDADAQDRAERIGQLADDYARAFHRNPNPEDLKTARQLRDMGREDILLPETELIPEGGGFRVREIPDRFIRVPGKVVNEALKNAHGWERRAWVGIIPDAIEGRDGDPVEVARDLILWMPANLRAKCHGCYPTDPDAFEAATAAVAKRISAELGLWRACGDADPVAVGRAVLRGLGLTKDQARSALRGTDLAQQSGPRDPGEKK